MKLWSKILVVLLFILASLSPGLGDDNVRTFGGDYIWPSSPFYAETEFYVEGRISLHSRTVTWFRNPQNYRYERLDWPEEGMRAFLVRSGTHVYAALTVREHPRNPRWACTPSFWIVSDNLEAEFQHEWRMNTPVLVGNEEIHGIRVEHWRGHNDADRPLEIWIGSDPRFPMVMKVESISDDRIMRWEINHLRLERIPPHVLTPQVQPESGLSVLLSLQHKPLWMIFLWYVLFVLALGWLIRSLVSGKHFGLRVLPVTTLALAFIGLLWVAPDLSRYLNHVSGLPVLLLIGGIVAAMLIYCIKRFPMPGDVRLFAGTRWPIAVWTLFAAGVALLISTSCPEVAIIREAFQLPVQGLPLLPQTLVTVAIYCAIWAALEEVLARGYITALLQRRFSSNLLVNIIQSLVFTAWHIPKIMKSMPTGSPYILELGFIFVFGLIYGHLRLKYRNLGAPWLVHTGYNIGFFYGLHAGNYGLLTSLMAL